MVLNGVSHSIAIEYKWLPIECPSCGTFKHRCEDIAAIVSRDRPMQQAQASTDPSVPAQVPLPPPVVAETPQVSQQGWNQVKGKKKKPPQYREGQSFQPPPPNEVGSSLKLKDPIADKGLSLSKTAPPPSSPTKVRPSSLLETSSSSRAVHVDPAGASNTGLLGAGVGSELLDSFVYSEDDLLSPDLSSKAHTSFRRVETNQEQLLALDPALPLVKIPAASATSGQKPSRRR